MIYLTVNPDNSIEDITEIDESGGGIEIMLDPEIDDMLEVKNNRFGHSVFDYIDGVIVLNQARYDAELLPDIIKNKIEELKAEGVARMSARIAGIYDLEVVNLTREFWLSIDPGARQPTADFQYVIDVYQAGKDAVIVIKAFTDAASVTAYNVETAPAWPA